MTALSGFPFSKSICKQLFYTLVRLLILFKKRTVEMQLISLVFSGSTPAK